MSLLTTEPREQKFLDRFENVWASLRRYQVRQGLCQTFLSAVVGLAVLVVADYVLELSWHSRAAGLAVAGIVTLLVLWSRVISPLRWWTRPRTAVQIETRFPQLGQRIRTVIQYGGLPPELIDSEGITPTLVEALEEETDLRVQPLPLDAIVPGRRLGLAAGVAATPARVLITAALLNGEWRTALGRALLGNRPYTTLAVKPGNLLVDQGASVPLSIELKGRLKRHVVLETRPAGRDPAEWKRVELDAPERGPASHREAKLEKVNDPLVYRIVAGPAASPDYKIDVRYPLAVQTFEVNLRPPAYTGAQPGTVKGGDLKVIEGTSVGFRLAFDGVPAEASLVLTDASRQTTPKKGEKESAPQVVPLKLEGKTYTAELANLTKGLAYEVVARTTDGRHLPKNRYRIIVHEDRPPRVSFDQPNEALEVHPIAEVLHRIRAGDDFGLTRAGIVFRFNNGDEETLIARDFKTEPGKSTTAATLEEMMLLEKFAATQTDSVTYYAFAEDNYPSGARRTETDLRYIDIRPFKREYKAGESGEESGEQSTTLGELIARQRFNLNRAVRLAKHKPTDRVPADDPLKIAGFEETLVGLVREFTEGVEGIAGERIEPLHQAEESMLAAVAALDRGRNADAPPPMVDALRHLIKVRDTLRQLIAEDPSAAAELRNFDRAQTQKIRKNKKNEEEAEEIVSDLERLAQDEDFVYKTLASAASSGEQPARSETEKTEAEESKDQPAESAKSKGPQAQNPGDQSGQEGDQGKDGNGEKARGKGQDEGTSGGMNDRRALMERQEKIAGEARDIEERLKRLEDVSDLSRARMAKAAEATEKASSELARGSTREATETTKAGAAMLHELARQVRGEITPEVAQELAMARDLADELAEREAEFGQMPSDSSQGSNGEQSGKSESSGKGKAGSDPGGWGALSDPERLERMEEAARTLEEWLKGASQRAEGKAAEQIRELMDESNADQVLERAERIGALHTGGQKPEARREAQEFAQALEVLARRLDIVQREIVAPELAALVENDRRVGELMERLKTLKTDAQITEWHREAAELVRELEKAGLTRAAETLTEAMEKGGWGNPSGRWNWGVGDYDFRVAPLGYTRGLTSVSTQIRDKIQELMLKDLKAARDEVTPPEFKELVERYYEVLSRGGSR